MNVASSDEFGKSHARLIERLYAQAEAARWSLSLDEFRDVLHRSLSARFGTETPADSVIESYLASLFIEDLALAAACERGTQSAWVEFLGRFRPVLLGTTMTIVRDESRAQEATDALYADLYGLEERDGRRRSLFRYFHARSSLASWLRSVAARNSVDGYRADRRSEALKARLTEESESAAGTAPSLTDPDRVRHLEMLRQALSGALAALPPRERLRLSYYHVQELTLAEVGKLLGEHESTVSRKLDQTRRQLREEIERRLRADHGLSEEDLLACYQAALEGWPFEVTRELA
jgi:RNA polymerase sigma-70 factor (ECF subfamily)